MTDIRATVMAESIGGVATVDLWREHALIRRGIDLLEHAGRRLAGGRAVGEDALLDLVHLLRRLVDGCHHAKEEMQLYPAMRSKGLPADVRLRALLAAHGESRDYLATLIDRKSVV